MYRDEAISAYKGRDCFVLPLEGLAMTDTRFFGAGLVEVVRLINAVKASKAQPTARDVSKILGDAQPRFLRLLSSLLDLASSMNSSTPTFRKKPAKARCTAPAIDLCQNATCR